MDRVSGRRPGENVHLLDNALSDGQVWMIPVVLTELLSDPGLASDVAETLAQVPMIDLEAGYWQRAGLLRSKVCRSAAERGSQTPLSLRPVSTGMFRFSREIRISMRLPMPLD